MSDQQNETRQAATVPTEPSTLRLGGEQAQEKLFTGNLAEINEAVLLEGLMNFPSKNEYLKELIRFDKAEVTTTNGLNDFLSKSHQYLKDLVSVTYYILEFQTSNCFFCCH